MKIATHNVDIYEYPNPSDLSDKIIHTFKISYSPTSKWYRFNILVNGLWCNEFINITEVYCGQPSSTRKIIAKSIYNYNKNIYSTYKYTSKMTIPSYQSLKFLTSAFERCILRVKKISDYNDIVKYKLDTLKY